MWSESDASISPKDDSSDSNEREICDSQAIVERNKVVDNLGQMHSPTQSLQKDQEPVFSHFDTLPQNEEISSTWS